MPKIVHDAPKMANVTFILFPKFQMLAYVLATETLRVANKCAGREVFRWQTRSATNLPVQASNGALVAPDMVDWDLAVSLGSRLAGEGPKVSWAEAADAVTELRAGAERSTPLVREFTGLDGGDGTAPVLVVDRPGWVTANAEGIRTILSPIA